MEEIRNEEGMTVGNAIEESTPEEGIAEENPGEETAENAMEENAQEETLIPENSTEETGLEEDKPEECRVEENACAEGNTEEGNREADKTEDNKTEEIKSEEDSMEGNRVRHRGRFSQVFICLGKFFRMFIFQNDWKVLPMAAIIAGLVSFVVGANLFKTQEGTLIGSFALACICIWNGFFNSIQVICRERAIVKREHRSGLHISSYILAHMIYQGFLCLCQTVITIVVCNMTRVTFPAKGLILPWPMIDIGITIFLTTYCADIMALMVSAIVHTTTTAMTVMPFMLIFQLVFSGGFFQLDGIALKITDYTVAKWGLTALCTQGNYNGLPMVTLWNAVARLQNLEVMGSKPISEFMRLAQDNGLKDQILEWSGRQNQNPVYAYDPVNVLNSWMYLLLFTLAYAVIAVIFLEFIDRDKR